MADTDQSEEPSRILLAEDDDVSRKILAARIESWGYFCDAYSDGSAAMMAIRRKGAPKVAIIDWRMPEMDGLEICRRVREGEWPIYLIMLTAKERREDLVEALEAGAHDYLVKPCDPEELKARIRVGLRVIDLQLRLERRVRELEVAGKKIIDLQDRLYQ